MLIHELTLRDCRNLGELFISDDDVDDGYDCFHDGADDVNIVDSYAHSKHALAHSERPVR